MATMKGPQQQADLALLEAAVADARRRIGRGERPAYDLRLDYQREGVIATVVQMPTVVVNAVDRDEAATLASTRIAEILQEPEDAFDVLVDG